MTKNKIWILPQIPMRDLGSSFLFKIIRLQFPLKIAFALTINRAQGQSATEYGILLLKMDGPMDIYMLPSLSATIQTIFTCGQNNLKSKIMTYSSEGKM